MLNKDCWMEADSTVFAPQIGQHRQRKTQFCLRSETASHQRFWWNWKDEHHFSRKRMGVPSQQSRSRANKGQCAQRSSTLVWPECACLVAMAWDKVRKVGRSREPMKTRPESFDVKIPSISACHRGVQAGRWYNQPNSTFSITKGGLSLYLNS